MKKIILSICTIIIALFSICAVSAGAASASAHIVVGLGRSSAIVSKDSGVKEVQIESVDDDPNAMFCTPISENGKVYVPMRFIFESVGFKVEWDATENAVCISDRTNFAMWVNDGATGFKTLTVEKAFYKTNSFKLITKNGTTLTVNALPMVNYLERNYIALDELEKFGFMVHHDYDKNMIHIMRNIGNNSFENSFKDYFTASSYTIKNFTSAEYFSTLKLKGAALSLMEEYVGIGTKHNNGLNNSLAMKIDNNTLLGLVGKVTNMKGFAQVTEGARQFTMVNTTYRDYVYFVNNQDKLLYKIAVKGGRCEGSPSKVELPDWMAGKSISQIIVANDRIFFVAYDYYSAYGGHVYMALVGNEKNTLVRLTTNRAWNIYLSDDYKLYYTNMEKMCTLFAIDLKDTTTLKTICLAPYAGVVGKCEFNYGIQSISLDDVDHKTFYYTDLHTGSINSVNSGIITELVKSDYNTIYNFLNVRTTDKGKTLYYIEYPNGNIGSFDACKVMAMDLSTKKLTTLYNSDKMLMQLTLVDDAIYCTDATYTKLYKIDYVNGAISVNVIE